MIYDCYEYLNEKDKTYIDGFYAAIDSLDHITIDLPGQDIDSVLNKVYQEIVETIKEEIGAHLTATAKEITASIVDRYPEEGDNCDD